MKFDKLGLRVTDACLFAPLTQILSESAAEHRLSCSSLVLDFWAAFEHLSSRHRCNKQGK